MVANLCAEASYLCADDPLMRAVHSAVNNSRTGGTRLKIRNAVIFNLNRMHPLFCVLFFFLLQMMAYLYAAGSYLFADHHLMCGIHLAMAKYLCREDRMSEAAYHQHQCLVVYCSIFSRYVGIFALLGLGLSLGRLSHGRYTFNATN